MINPFARPLNDIYDDEVPAVVVHGDRIDSLLVSLPSPTILHRLWTRQRQLLT